MVAGARYVKQFYHPTIPQGPKEELKLDEPIATMTRSATKRQVQREVRSGRFENNSVCNVYGFRNNGTSNARKRKIHLQPLRLNFFDYLLIPFNTSCPIIT